MIIRKRAPDQRADLWDKDVPIHQAGYLTDLLGSRAVDVVNGYAKAARPFFIVFTSDDGGERFADTWPFTGRKTELLEGGLRNPARQMPSERRGMATTSI